MNSHKETWSVYSNTLPLSDLSDGQAAQLFNAWRKGGVIEVKQLDVPWWSVTPTPEWDIEVAYRIEKKSERELFIEASVQLMTSETERTMEQMFGAQFDAGARYKDLTQFFGDNI